MVPRLSDRKVVAGRPLCGWLLLAGLLLTAVPAARAQFTLEDTTAVPADRQLAFDTNLGLLERATREAVERALAGLRLPPGSEVRLHSLTNNEGAWFVEDYIARFLSDRGYRIYLAKPEKPAAPGAAAPGAGGPVSGASSMSDIMKAANQTPPDSTKPSLSSAVAGRPAGADTSGPAADLDDDRPASPRSGPGNAGTSPKAKGPGAAGTVVPEELNPVPEGEGLVLTFRLVEFSVSYHDSWRRGLMGPRVVERLASVDLYCRLVSGGAENVLWVGGGKSDRLDVVPKAKLDLLEGMSYPFKPPSLPTRPFSRVLEPALVLGIVGGLVFLFYSNQN